MVSFAIVSLHTNVPIKETLIIVQDLLKKYGTLKNFTLIPISNIMELLSTCLDSNYFQLNENFFK